MRFDEVFSEEELIGLLARQRAAAAKSRHDEQFLRNLSRSAKPPSAKGEIDKCFPPRRLWLRSPRTRRQGRSSLNLNAYDLSRTVSTLLRSAEHQNDDWALRISHLLAQLRMRGLASAAATIDSPKVLPKEKGPHTYRAISNYALNDRVIIGQCAKYLRHCFDSGFLECSYAFRTARPHQNAPQHHDAVKALIAYRKQFSGKPLWVAECDIRGFFDCVDHEIAKTCFQEGIKRASQQGITVDKRAASIFYSFLRSYTFSTVAAPQAQEWFNKHDRLGILKWPEEALTKIHADLNNCVIGIPQGGAISCLIANLMLHSADEAVTNEGHSTPSDPDLFYARYCDDMILMHPDRDRAKCESAFERYQDRLKKLKLPCHAPITVEKYDATFWDSKSKNPYQWGVISCRLRLFGENALVER